MKLWKRCILTLSAAAMLVAGAATAAFAGEWQYLPDGSWAYEDNGVFLTGWQKIDNVWYYLDPATCLWVEHPPLNENTAYYLLENAVNETHWYDNEEAVMHYVVDSSNSTNITVSIKLETRPNDLTGTLNTFVIDRRTRVAQSVQTKQNLQLE